VFVDPPSELFTSSAKAGNNSIVHKQNAKIKEKKQKDIPTFLPSS
jgi:hypothetical protein